ncbi:hypothetical protein FB476_1173 [Ornithinimicrobium humiphilum]|uniref:DUF6318 domain-containing protein n=1 Tax=Ornithinimicrobium humiphilum TaxID=125288 RepID=A0A543KML8_9MICO|nr:DUF6318 family protein [Ornithinimicrobium humiphilum]TQM96309.1 hypothetical protein FB476_1173 [Ornithinimicrobium humiphilum]
MNRSAIAMSAALGLAVLAGCGSSTEPSAPPTSEDALTTSAPAVTSEPEPAETTEAPTADGPPEMTDEMSEQTEAGSEAFVAYYFDALNAAHIEELDVATLRAMATDECKTCAAFADAAETAPFGEPYAEVRSATAMLFGEDARVKATLEQMSDGQMVPVIVTLTWGDEQWRVKSIQADEQ